MKDLYDFAPLQEALASAQNLAIVLPKRLTKDKVAAALSLSLSLQKSGKKVSISSSAPITVEFSSLIGVNKIKEKIAGKDFVISVRLDESVERIRYNMDESDKNNKKLNLIIQTKDGFAPFSPEKVIYSQAGSMADSFLSVGASSKEDLGKIYFDNKELFDKADIVNIDVNSENQRFGKLNLINSEMSSYSEFIALLLDSLKLPLDEDIATNLLLGIKEGTDNFSLEKSSATTFEAVAFCLRAGGRKPRGEQIPFKKEKQRGKIIKEETNFSKKPSPDWFKPKIYKGNTRI